MSYRVAIEYVTSRVVSIDILLAWLNFDSRETYGPLTSESWFR